MDKKNSYQYILSGHYFIHFSIMGIFLPYFNLYCYHLNFTEFQIGTLSGLRILSMILFSIFWGFISDYYLTRKNTYIVCTFLSALTWILLEATSQFYPMLIIIIIHSAFYGPIIAFLETFTIETLHLEGAKKSRYGNIRVWGSISFILMAVFLGKITDTYSLDIIILLIFIPSAIQALLSFNLPNTPKITKMKQKSHFKEFLSLKSVLFLTASFFMLVSHGTYYGYFSIHLENSGFDHTFIGIAWAVATASEIIIMLKSHTIFKYFSIKHMLIFSFIIAALRWLILFITVSPWVILLSQVLHAATYGIFHIACILYIDKLSSEKAKTFGQILNNATSYGLGIMTGIIINGIFFKQYASLLFIFSSLSALIGCAIILTSFRIHSE